MSLEGVAQTAGVANSIASTLSTVQDRRDRAAKQKARGRVDAASMQLLATDFEDEELKAAQKKARLETLPNIAAQQELEREKAEMKLKQLRDRQRRGGVFKRLRRTIGRALRRVCCKRRRLKLPSGGVDENSKQSGPPSGGVDEKSKQTELSSGGVDQKSKETQLPSGGVGEKSKQAQLPSGGVNEKIKETQLPFGGVDEKSKQTQLPSGGVDENSKQSGPPSGGVDKKSEQAQLPSGGVDGPSPGGKH